MQQIMRDEDGDLWEVDAAGNVIGPANKPAAAPNAGRIFTLPPNPKDVRTEARQDRAETRAERAADRADATANRQITAAERAAEKMDKPTELQSKSAGFLGRMMQAEKNFNALPAEERGPRSIPRQMFRDIAPGLENSYVNSPERQKADQAVENFIAASLRQESGAAIGKEEFDRQYNIFFPAPGDSEEVIAQKADARRQTIEGFRIAAGPLADEAIATIQGAEQKADNEVPGQGNGADTKPGVVATGDDMRFEPNNRVKSQVDSLISAGSFETANAVLRKAGFPAISPIERQKIQQWQKANPGKAYTASQIGRDVPLTAMQSLAGSPLGAGAARFANGATAGLVGAVAGERGKGALDAMAAANPKAALAGDIAGGVLGAFGAEAGAAAALGGRGAAWLAPRLGDAAYGGMSGLNAAQEGEGAVGALAGAGAGVAGGMLGQFGANQIGRAVRGVRDPAVQYLRGRGVPLTVGQTIGNSGRFGQVVDGVEEAMTSIPGVGNMVDARRMDGLQAWNRAVMQDAAAPGAQITATGAEGMGQVRQSVGDAYDAALGPARIDVNDPQYVADVAAAQAAAQAIPNVQPTMPSDFSQASLANRLQPANPTGQITGRDFQEAYRGLARDARGRVNGDYGHEVGQVARQGQEALADVLERQNPGAFDGFLEANAANRRANVLAQAMNPNAVDELVTPAQLGRADFNSTSRLTNRVNAASGNRPFYDLTSAGQSVLPSTLPDSGTAKRAIVGALTTGTLGGGGAYFGGSEGAATGAGGGAILAALLAAGGTRGGQRILTSALADRPDLAVELGEALSRNARYGGILGAATATPLAIGQ